MWSVWPRSQGGIFPMPVAPVYSAAKAGVVQVTRSAGPLLAKRGIRLMAACPGEWEQGRSEGSCPRVTRV